MTISEFAKQLDGREYGNFIALEETKQAKDAGFVVVYGASDDLMEFDGAFYDEIGSYGGAIAYITETGLFESKCDNPECPYEKIEQVKCKTIEAIWCAPDSPDWTYKTDIPHATFNIMEDGEIYCRGIVFDIKSL